MARIEQTSVEAIVYARVSGMLYAWHYFDFTTFTEDNGTKHYFVGEREVTKEEGNAEFLDLKKQNQAYLVSKADKGKKILDSFKVTRTAYDLTYDELLERLGGMIDRYTDYIDNPKQQASAEQNNRKIRGWIEQVQRLKEAKA